MLHFSIAAQITQVAQLMLSNGPGTVGNPSSNKETHPLESAYFQHVEMHIYRNVSTDSNFLKGSRRLDVKSSSEMLVLVCHTI